jgi:hypothetical protein
LPVFIPAVCLVESAVCQTTPVGALLRMSSRIVSALTFLTVVLPIGTLLDAQTVTSDKCRSIGEIHYAWFPRNERLLTRNLPVPQTGTTHKVRLPVSNPRDTSREQLSNQTGAVSVGAHVRLTRNDCSATQEVPSGNNGQFSFDHFAPGLFWLDDYVGTLPDPSIFRGSSSRRDLHRSANHAGGGHCDNQRCKLDSGRWRCRKRRLKNKRSRVC